MWVPACLHQLKLTTHCIDLQHWGQARKCLRRRSDNGRELYPSRVQNVPKWCPICAEMSQNLPPGPGGVQRGIWIRKIVQNCHFVRSLLEVILACFGVFRSRAFWASFARAAKSGFGAAWGASGAVSAPFWLHFWSHFGSRIEEGRKSEN